MTLNKVFNAPSGDSSSLKRCLLRCNNSQEQHGVVTSCLELRNKACDILAIDKFLAPVTLPGRRSHGGDYFLCLPANAKFVASAWNQWGTHSSDGGTAWITQESLDRDETDRGGRQDPRADLGTRGTRLTPALETAPPKLPLQARSSWR
uniref:CIDE-N domain-containing protein n=1 Tax=Capra hircus TaxID=9925 RepID=A0A8C2PKC1_CAPHI